MPNPLGLDPNALRTVQEEASLPSWIDISAPLHDGLVPWPGDAPFRLERVSDLARGDFCTFSTFSTSAHAATHVDAPMHFLKRGLAVDALPIEATVGRARVLPIRNTRLIGPEELRTHRIRAGERLLFKTRNSKRDRESAKFFTDYIAVSPEAAHFLASRRIRAVGTDGPSIGHGECTAETHRILLGAGIWVIEGLDLSHAPVGRCDLVCLPLRIVGSDGAPARAILRPRSR
jgi:arylformamidase